MEIALQIKNQVKTKEEKSQTRALQLSSPPPKWPLTPFVLPPSRMTKLPPFSISFLFALSQTLTFPFLSLFFLAFRSCSSASFIEANQLNKLFLFSSLVSSPPMAEPEKLNPLASLFLLSDENFPKRKKCTTSLFPDLAEPTPLPSCLLAFIAHSRGESHVPSPQVE